MSATLGLDCRRSLRLKAQRTAMIIRHGKEEQFEWALVAAFTTPINGGNAVPCFGAVTVFDFGRMWMNDADTWTDVDGCRACPEGSGR